MKQQVRNSKVISINDVAEGMKDFILKVMVVHKNVPRSWKNSKGTGRLFNFEIVDYKNINKEQFEMGESIQCTIFGDRAQKFYKLLQHETIYYVSKCLVKATQYRSNRVKHTACLQLDDNSRIEDEDGLSIEKDKDGNETNPQADSQPEEEQEEQSYNDYNNNKKSYYKYGSYKEYKEAMKEKEKDGSSQY